MLSLLIGCFMKQADLPQATQTETIEIPAIGAPKQFTPPRPQPTELSFGSGLWLQENHTLPLLVIRIALPGGYGSDPEGEWGRAGMVSDLLLEAVGDKTALELSEILHQNAIDISTSTGAHNTYLRLAFHKDRLDTVLPIVSDIIFAPQFDEKDWKRVQTNQINDVHQMREDARSVTAEYDGYFLYGTTHPLGIPSEGTPTTLKNLDRNKAKQWHLSRLDPSKVYFSVVGDISMPEIKNKLEENLNKWTKTEWSAPEIKDVKANTGIVVIDMPGAEQTAIRIFSPVFEKNAEQEIAANLAGIVMGGSFTSRLNSVLREEKGYTYGVSARFLEDVKQNYFVVNTSVQTAVTAPALTDLLAILKTAEGEYSDEELQKAKGSFRSSIIESSASRKNLAANNLYALIDQEAPNYLSQELQKSQEVTKEDMMACSPYLSAENGIILLGGDVSKIETSLTEAGFDFKIVTLPE